LIANAWVQTKNAGWQADPGTSKLMIWPATLPASAWAQNITDPSSSRVERIVMRCFTMSLLDKQLRSKVSAAWAGPALGGGAMAAPVGFVIASK
jgi:hypothetical protein